MNTISFFVHGEPKGQPRQKQRIVFPKGGGRPFATNYDPGDAEIWKREVRMVAVDFVPKTGPVLGPIELELTFYFPRPASHYGTGKNAGRLKESAPTRHAQKPDRDNLDKAIMDSLKTVGMFRDDAQVCDGPIKKFWGVPGQTGCKIVLIQLEEVSEVGLTARQEMVQPTLEAGLELFNGSAVVT